MTPEFIAMVEADRAVMSITPMGRKLNHVKYDSKFTPVDQVVAFDEEFEMQYAGAAGTFTVSLYYVHKSGPLNRLIDIGGCINIERNFDIGGTKSSYIPKMTR